MVSMTAETATPKRKRGIGDWIGLIALLALIAVGVSKVFRGGDLGASCSRDADCKGFSGTFCLRAPSATSGVCSHPCTTDADCGKLSCRPIAWLAKSSGEHVSDSKACAR